MLRFLVSQENTIAVIPKKIGATDQTYYRRRKEHNQVRPHSVRNNRPPAPEAI
jgi:hypothetical protein